MRSENDQAQSTAIPREVLDRLLRHVWDPAEIKVVLAVCVLGGDRQPVSVADIAAHQGISHGLRGDGSNRSTQDRLWEAVQAAVAHGILVNLTTGDQESWLVLATESNYRRAHAGQFSIPDSSPPVPLAVERPDVFRLYEQNIGLVTPIIADKLADALQQYPEGWIEDAIGEAVAYNRRSWRYIERILENWSTEGRRNETNQRNNEEHVSPGKNLLGKYAPLFRKR